MLAMRKYQKEPKEQRILSCLKSLKIQRLMELFNQRTLITPAPGKGTMIFLPCYHECDEGFKPLTRLPPDRLPVVTFIVFIYLVV